MIREQLQSHWRISFQTFSLVLLMVTSSIAEETFSYKLAMMPTDIDASLRGAAVMGNRQAWITGSNGTAMRTMDGGQTWQRMKVPNADILDFRDVEILSDRTILLMSAGSGVASRVLRSTDSGNTWTVVLQNHHPDGFFNGMSFNKAGSFGALYGDAIDGHFDIHLTNNGGKSWTALNDSQRPVAVEDEHGFAASGTGIVINGSTVHFVTGGSTSRVLSTTDQGKHWTKTQTPIRSGRPSSGIFPIAFQDRETGVVVGGDYLEPTHDQHNVARTTDGGKTCTTVADDLQHRACVRSLGNQIMIACGRTGVALSKDGGVRWENIATEGYFTLAIDNEARVGYLAGNEGRIARLEWSN